MSHDAKQIWFLNPLFSNLHIKAAMLSFFEEWIPKHSFSENFMLYHYTTLDGLKGIINSRSIWLTNTSTLNDPLELIYGKDLILSILNDHISAEAEDSIKILLRGLLVQVSTYDTISYKTYVACFCESINLLSQWREYSAKGGGYNLGFSFNSSTKFYNTFNGSREESYIILRKIIYDPDEQVDLITKYITSIISSAKTAMEYSKKHEELPSNWPSVAAMESANILLDLLLSFKSPIFEEEKEWRLIIGREPNYKPEQLHFRENKGNLVPYLVTQIVEETEEKSFFPIRSINFGPTLDVPSTKSAIELYVNKATTIENPVNIDVIGLHISGAGYTLR